jgi:hypothetical protein
MQQLRSDGIRVGGRIAPDLPPLGVTFRRFNLSVCFHLDVGRPVVLLRDFGGLP